MTHLIKAVLAILISNALLMMGNGVFASVISVDITQAGFSPVVVGAVQAAYYLGFLIGAWASGVIIARLGHERSYAAMAAVLCTAVLGHALYINPTFWGVLRLLEGACMAILFTVIESGMNLAVTNQQRGRIFSFYLTTAYLASSVGQGLLQFSKNNADTPYLLITCLFSLSLLPMMITGRPVKSYGDQAPKEKPILNLDSLKKLYQALPLAVWGAIGAGCLNGSFYSMMAVYLKQRHYQLDEIAHFMGGAMIAAFALQWPVGKLSDHFSRIRILRGVVLLGGTLTAIISFLPQSIWQEGLVFIYISLSFTVYGLVVSYANDHIPDYLRTTISAAMLLIFSIGGIVGPIIVSTAMTHMGAHGYFVIISAVMFSILGITYCWAQKQKVSMH